MIIKLLKRQDSKGNGRGGEEAGKINGEEGGMGSGGPKTSLTAKS